MITKGQSSALLHVLSWCFVSSSVAAVQYAMECKVDPNTKQETCEQVIFDEHVQIPDLIQSGNEIQKLFENGGLMVSSGDCADELASCSQITEGKKSELCEPEFRLREKCKRSCEICEQKITHIGVEQTRGGTPEEVEGVDKVLTEMVRYLQEEVLVESGYEGMYRECINNHELCAFWASFGECIANPGYMTQNCMLACKKCSEHPNYQAS